jgi:hypothetical protein
MRVTVYTAVLCGVAGSTSSSSAAYLNVIGSPTYTPDVGGYQGTPGNGTMIDGAGNGYGTANRFDASANGSRVIRWNGSGSTELGNLGTTAGGSTATSFNAVNSAGTAVGRAKLYIAGSDKGYRGVRWDAGGTAATELGNLGTGSGGNSTVEAFGINGAGTIVGTAQKYVGTSFRGDRAVRWEAGSTVAVELGALGTSTSGSTSASARKINDAGVAIGSAQKYDGTGVQRGTRGVRWDAGSTVAIELGNIGLSANGTTSAVPTDINASGTIVGQSAKYDALDNWYGDRAVRWDAGGTAATELANLGTDASSFTQAGANAVNDVGTLVGWAVKYVGGVGKGPRAVRWDAGGTAATELGTLGTNSAGSTNARALDINAAGGIVGFAIAPTPSGGFGDDHAVYWGLDGVALDLNTLIDPASGWVLNHAESITDTGLICGYGTFDPDGVGGQAQYTRLFLLQLPEPTAAALIGPALAALLGGRRRRRH